MSDRTRQSAIQIAGMVLFFAALFNVAFYFLSDLYFEERVLKYGAHEALAIPNVRRAFAVFTGAVALMSVLAVFAPRAIGHAIPTAAGLAALIAAYLAWGAGLQGTLAVSLVIVGVLMPVLAYLSWWQRSRAAWSFLIALCGVLALILLFGAPKVRGLVGVGLWSAMVIPGLLAVATIALSMVHREYEPGPA